MGTRTGSTVCPSCHKPDGVWVVDKADGKFYGCNGCQFIWSPPELEVTKHRGTDIVETRPDGSCRVTFIRDDTVFMGTWEKGRTEAVLSARESLTTFLRVVEGLK